MTGSQTGIPTKTISIHFPNPLGNIHDENYSSSVSEKSQVIFYYSHEHSPLTQRWWGARKLLMIIQSLGIDRQSKKNQKRFSETLIAIFRYTNLNGLAIRKIIPTHFPVLIHSNGSTVIPMISTDWWLSGLLAFAIKYRRGLPVNVFDVPIHLSLNGYCFYDGLLISMDKCSLHPLLWW